LEEEAVTFLQKMAKQLKLPHRIYRVCLPSFLANVNVSSRLLYAIAHPSVCHLSIICDARAPFSGSSNFWQYFYSIWCGDVPGEPLRRGS